MLAKAFIKIDSLEYKIGKLWFESQTNAVQDMNGRFANIDVELLRHCDLESY